MTQRQLRNWVTYRTVDGRLAVDYRALELDLKIEYWLEVMQCLGLQMSSSTLCTDIPARARACIGRSVYRRGSDPKEAPGVVDCSSLVKWVFGQSGIWLPRYTIEQRECGRPVELDQLRLADLVFVSGAHDWYWSDPSIGVGHVGIVTGEGLVTHAADSRAGVVETAITKFVGKGFRGARRVIDQSTYCFLLPECRTIETASQLRWMILSRSKVV